MNMSASDHVASSVVELRSELQKLPLHTVHAGLLVYLLHAYRHIHHAADFNLVSGYISPGLVR